MAGVSAAACLGLAVARWLLLTVSSGVLGTSEARSCSISGMQSCTVCRYPALAPLCNRCRSRASCPSTELVPVGPLTCPRAGTDASPLLWWSLLLRFLAALRPAADAGPPFCLPGAAAVVPLIALVMSARPELQLVSESPRSAGWLLQVPRPVAKLALHRASSRKADASWRDGVYILTRLHRLYGEG